MNTTETRNETTPAPIRPGASGTGTLIGMGACYALGTFTDNFYKQAAILMAASAGMTGTQSIATVLFSLPFVLFSAWAGAAADRVPKKTIVIAVKTVEFLSLFLGAYMLFSRNWTGILAVIFFMGAQSTFFSPAINGAIPETFTPDRVPRANSLIKLASTAAILAGFAMAGFVLDLRPGSLPKLPHPGLVGEAYGRAMAGVFVTLVALFGLFTAFTLRRKPAANGNTAPFPWTGPVQSLRHVNECRKDRELILAILADAWFYGVAAIAVISIANLAASLGYSKSLSGLMMALLMIGVAVGALAGGRFSLDAWRRVILPVGTAMAAALLLVALTPLVPVFASCDAQFFWFGGTLFLTGFCGGMYIIPLESFIQVRPAAHEKGKVIAVSNFLSFVAMAVFGAAFQLIGQLPPALNFAVYGVLTVCFLYFAARAWLTDLPTSSLRDDAFSLLGFALRCILSLRYSVTEKGLRNLAPLPAKDAATNRPGMLILPNHPALVDPILVWSRLAGLGPRPLADEGQMRGVVQGLAARFLRAVTIPDLEQTRANRDGAAQTLRGLRNITDALRQGDNVLLYPAGKVYRSPREIIGNKSAVSRILAEVPEARVVLVRTTGLWGSGFSYASGKVPHVMPLIFRGMLTVLANLLVFTPRRTVTMEFCEPADLPRNGDKAALNGYLETFYNEAETPPVLVRRFFWQPRQNAAPLPEESTPAQCGTGAPAPALEPAMADNDMRDAVFAIIREQAGLAPDQPLDPEQRLAEDLHCDSLSLMETLMALEERFGHAVPGPESLVTVGDCLRAAAGKLETEEEIPPATVPETWFAASGPAGNDADGDRLPPPGVATIPEAFFRLCRENPDQPLTAERAGVRSRKAILTGVLALSGLFRALPGKRLGIMLPAVPAALAVWLAALHAGKEPVFINWTVGRRNLEHCLALAGCSHIVSASQLMDQVSRTGTPLDSLPVTWLAADTLATGLSLAAKLRAAFYAALHCSPLPFSLQTPDVPETAAILFTSGSETRPKGVPLSHANILCNAKDVLTALRIRKSDRVLAMLPPFHSFGLLVGLALPAVSGVPAAYHPNPTESAHLVATARDFKTTLLGATPAFLEGMLAKARGSDGLAFLRYAFAGAEKCPESVYRAFAEICPGGVLCEGYGITECSPVVAVNRPENPVAGSIGPVLPAVEAVLVREEDDADGVPRPVSLAGNGETGMLLVRGPSIFSGYLSSPAAGETSPPDPFVRFDGRNWYRTGDLAVMDPDGRLWFKGRRKRFVKFGGEMISLPMMEDVLQQAFASRARELREGLGEGSPFIAVVDLYPADNPDQVEVAAFTTLGLTVQEVNQALRNGGLSALHAVRRVTRLPEIPLLGSGKTDYRALRERV